MSADLERVVFSRHAVEFVAVAREYCAYLEQLARVGRPQFVAVASKLLPLLYYKAAMLPATEPRHEDGPPRHVTEGMYHGIRMGLAQLLGPFDDFPEVFDHRVGETDAPFRATLSEYLADVYQDLKNFAAVYQEGHPEEMNEALWECRLNFEEHWGIRLANAIRAVHSLAYGGAELSDPDPTAARPPQRDTSQWFIAQRQKDFDT